MAPESHASGSKDLLEGKHQSYPTTEHPLLTLAPELHMHLFKHLDIVTAACVGLTNKHFYAILGAVHGETPIRFYCLTEINDHTTFAFTLLPNLLKKRMEPLVWGGSVNR
ncbi:uncharacterized protein K444DRAFT_720868 [Hyaloscypha bicolor E]|uniref:F-box domain-containing protein n=1 Tax=Hyaloscypha bicolor E TaxID=1095630 RepID=A0A2J6TC34_9HELO|nr:uncharacterized protein K444DRAFT_720868 [Hyaloscypha bicolor E]PMD60581.1 hypothetical protein K444DRAFT_720868 [Hyaloscypha bicolor E]